MPYETFKFKWGKFTTSHLKLQAKIVYKLGSWTPFLFHTTSNLICLLQFIIIVVNKKAFLLCLTQTNLNVFFEILKQLGHHLASISHLQLIAKEKIYRDM
jgi:hypothetical protein